MEETILTQHTGFDWDHANIDKNSKKHGVLHWECEQVFFNEPLILFEDNKHSVLERRWYVLGKTDADRKLFIAFTLRKNLIRVISARDMNKQEKHIYEKN
jgi:uncharacterized DUF497 family protein